MASAAAKRGGATPPGAEGGEPSLVRKAAIGAAWMVLWRLTSRTIGLLNTIVVARLLVPADFGIFAMATGFLASLEAFSQLGIGEALVRSPEQDRGLYDCAFTIQLLRSLVVAAALAVGAPLAAAWFSDARLAPLLLALAVVTVAAGAENIGFVEYWREMDFRVQFMALLLPRLCEVATTVSAALWFRSYWVLVAGFAVGKLLYVAMTYALHPYRPRLSLAKWRALAGFSAWSWASSVARMAWEQTGTFVLGPVLGPARLAAYTLGNGLANLPVTQLVSPIGSVLFPSFSAANLRGADTVSLAPLVASTLLLPVLPLSLFMSAAANGIVSLLLGPRWAEAQPVIAVVAMGCVLQPFASAASAVMLARGRVDLDFKVMAISAVAKAAILALASSSGSMAVAAWGTLAAVLLQGAAFLLVLGKVGAMQLDRVAASWCRMACSAAVTAAALWSTGIAWRAGALSVPVAAWQTVLLAATALLAFTVAQLGIWWAAGRPEGPEHLLVTAIAANIPRPRRPRPSAPDRPDA